MVIATCKQKSKQTPNNNTAQVGGNAVLLSKKSGEAIAEILDEFRLDWESLGSNREKQKEFIRSEIKIWGRAHLRCGCLIHGIETNKVHRKFGYKSVAAFLITPPTK